MSKFDEAVFCPVHKSGYEAQVLSQVDELTAVLIARCKPDWKARFDPERVKGVVRAACEGKQPHGMHAVILGGTHFMLYQVCDMWVADGKALDEHLFVRIAPGELSRAMVALDQLASWEGCRFISLGSLLTANDEAMTRLTRPFGYQLATNILFKELPNGTR